MSSTETHTLLCCGSSSLYMDVYELVDDATSLTNNCTTYLVRTSLVLPLDLDTITRYVASCLLPSA